MIAPSVTTIIGGFFFAYISHSIYQMLQLFVAVKCTETPCYVSFLARKPSMQLALFVSPTRQPISSEVVNIHKLKNFDYWHEYSRDFEIDVPLSTRRNGSLYMHAVVALEGEPLEWRSLRRDGPTVVHTVSMTEYMMPRAETFKLLMNSQEGKVQSSTSTGNKDDRKKPTKKKKSSTAIDPYRPFTHLRSKIYINLLTDEITMSQQDVPPEMANLIHVNRFKEILPILYQDYFNTRLRDLVQVNKNMTEFNFTFHYAPMGTGKLRLMLLMKHAMDSLVAVGFVSKDVDEVKGIFSDTNVYLLCGTFLVSSTHLLFDFLSLKNDVSFWRKKKSYEGLSTRTTLWRAFSQLVIFLYLLDEQTTLIVLVPCCFSALIELWKCKKILRIQLSFSGIMQRTLNANNGTDRKGIEEQRTQDYDKEGMRYLSYALYPLCLCGAVYSLIYEPYRSWYSWTLNSLVNGVYAFGFLFMLPQLFINYKLKSVAALPWRAFMYKAFNTFIDDFFAFIITMPTAHRVACLRDDVVFLIYLYQRWLYPVDKTRIDNGLVYEEIAEATPPPTPTPPPSPSQVMPIEARDANNHPKRD